MSDAACPAGVREPCAVPEPLPVREGAPPVGTAEWRCRPSVGRDRRRRPLVPDDGTVLQAQLEHAGLTAVVVVPEEVPEPVAHVGLAEPAGPLEHVRVAADDGVRAGLGQRPDEQPLLLGGAALVLQAPVQVDHDDLVGIGRTHRLQKSARIRPTSVRDTGRTCASRPDGAAPLALRVVGGEDREARPVHLDPEGGECFAPVPADPEDLEPAVADRRKGVRDPRCAVVRAMVVGHRHHVDTRLGQHVERLGPGPEVEAVPRRLELLGVRSVGVGDRTLQVDHRQVCAGQGSRDRTDGAARPVEQVGELVGEVHVTGEGEGDDAGLRLGRRGGHGRRGVGRRRAAGRRI